MNDLRDERAAFTMPAALREAALGAGVGRNTATQTPQLFLPAAYFLVCKMGTRITTRMDYIIIPHIYTFPPPSWE